MRLPTFLGIGVEKAGTTSIYTYLRQHPQIFMSPVKETNFLEQDWDHHTIQHHREPTKRIDTFEKYCNLFKTAGQAIAIGEISPNYLFHHRTSLKRICRYVPDAKMIVILRDPIQRAFSDYLMHCRDVIHGGQPSPLIDQALDKKDTSFTLRKGFYYEPLKAFITYFGIEKIKVFLYDDLCADPIQLMKDMYRFVGVDDGFEPNITMRSQVSQVPKFRLINTLLRTQNPVRKSVARGLKLIFPTTIRQHIRSSLINLNSQPKDAVMLSPETHKVLTDLYRDDVQKLQALIQQDLSAWLVYRA